MPLPKSKNGSLMNRANESILPSWRKLLDRAGPQQRKPVVRPCVCGERGGDEQDLGSPEGQSPIELREPQVVANRQAQTAQRSADHDGTVPRFDGARLA